MRLVATVAAILVLAACATETSAPTDSEEDALTRRGCKATSPRTRPLELAVLPEAGEAPLVDALHEATKSIRLMVYMLGRDGVFAELKARAAAGVDVRVILDGNKQRSYNQRSFDELSAAGVQVKWSAPAFPYMHAKSFVVDDHVAVVSTGNFPAGLIARERNYVVRDHEKSDVTSLATIFDADWEGTEPSLACTRLVVSPVNAKERILNLVDGAKQSLLVESLELSDADVVARILGKKTEGRDVRVVLADPQWNSTNDNADTAAKLKAHDIPVRFIPKSRMLVHVKSILVDGKRAYLGSENMTKTSLEKNREVGLVVTDVPVVDEMTTTFEADFASATSF